MFKKPPSRVADDNSGNIAVKGVVLSDGGNLKLGRLLLPVTDLTILIDGIPIVITRVYDSLEAGRSADLSPGRRLGRVGSTPRGRLTASGSDRG